jgi:putative endonuclease
VPQNVRECGTARRSAGTGASVASAAMPGDLRHALGRVGEDLALAHMERLGYSLVARNHRTRFGEIDLVVCDAAALVFCEVKTRRANAAGRLPWETLHPGKQRRVRAMATSFLAEVSDRPRRRRVRFDAIGVVVDGRGGLLRLEHLEGAF